MEDLSKEVDDRNLAVFLPAVSTFINMCFHNQRKDPNYYGARMPKGFENGMETLNFLDPSVGAFFYKYGLYSAGHATLDVDKTQVKDSLIQNRDRNNTVIVGDSGGYQIGRGVIKFDWKNFEGKKSDEVRQSILDWLEYTADWSMMLDVPAWAASDKNQERTGLKTFSDCLKKTMHNNDFFIKNRLGNTKFLNVLQGDNWADCVTWYDAVKDLPVEGWAFGGKNACDLNVTLKRLIIMRDEGKLDNKGWLHVLGNAQMDWSCYLTQIRRAINKHINPNLTLSFDCASPFIATANALIYTDAIHTPNRWAIRMEKSPDSKLLKNSNIPFPWESAIGRRITLGDICHYGPGEVNRVGKEGKTSWDSMTYAILMIHNVYAHIKAVQKANRLMDQEFGALQGKIDWRDWRKLKNSDRTDELSNWVPRNILYLQTFIDELFTSETPMDMLDNAYSMLHSMASVRGAAQDHHTTFSEFFANADEVVETDGTPEGTEEALSKLELEFEDESKTQVSASR